MKKCIICQKKVDKNKALFNGEVYFCSQKCKDKYKEKLKEMESIVDWDNCC